MKYDVKIVDPPRTSRDGHWITVNVPHSLSGLTERQALDKLQSLVPDHARILNYKVYQPLAIR